MAHPDEHRSTDPDEKLNGLVRAIAAELLELGYRAAERRGEVFSGKRGARKINASIWEAMKAIQAGGKA